jgi:hypothetical protein
MQFIKVELFYKLHFHFAPANNLCDLLLSFEICVTYFLIRIFYAWIHRPFHSGILFPLLIAAAGSRF